MPYGGTMNIIVKDSASSSNNGAYACIDYSSKGTGKLVIRGVKVQCVEDSSYTWTYNPTTAADKKNVRAIRMHLLTRTKDKAVTKSTGPINVGEINVNPTGDNTWRLYSTLIKVPNNGTF